MVRLQLGLSLGEFNDISATHALAALAMVATQPLVAQMEPVPARAATLLLVISQVVKVEMAGDKTLEEYITEAYDWRVQQDVADGDVAIMCFRERKSRVYLKEKESESPASERVRRLPAGRVSAGRARSCCARHQLLWPTWTHVWR